MSLSAVISVSVRSASGTPQASSVDVLVRRQDRDELRLAAGQHIDHATWHVRRGEDLTQRDRRQWPGFGRDQHDRVARDERGREPADEAQER